MKRVNDMRVPKEATHAVRGSRNGIYAKVCGIWMFSANGGSIREFYNFGVTDVTKFIGDNKIVECK